MLFRSIYELNDIDPRFWFAGKTAVIDYMIDIPSDASGQYTLYINLPDPKPVLRGNPDFSIRLANEEVWDSSTGYNKVMTFNI